MKYSVWLHFCASLLLWFFRVLLPVQFYLFQSYAEVCAPVFPLFFPFVFLFSTNIPFCSFTSIAYMFLFHRSVHMAQWENMPCFLVSGKTQEDPLVTLNIFAMCTCLVTNDGSTIWWMVFKWDIEMYILHNLEGVSILKGRTHRQIVFKIKFVEKTSKIWTEGFLPASRSLRKSW